MPRYSFWQSIQTISCSLSLLTLSVALPSPAIIPAPSLAIQNAEVSPSLKSHQIAQIFIYQERRGYELYWDGKRVGTEPKWNRQQAIANLEWNKKTYPNKQVEGFWYGQRIGYELYFDGHRVGFEPSWNQQQAIKNFQMHKRRHPHVQVEATLDGFPLPQ
ncbi:hypothetical protein [Pantanalinema sp. GBBB05]|uniref:hypothetical protein n=1 Tax=Pantanalinema sp. GBBB05 TaxID=2604139 RepID=UPI001D7D125C|nr:hypothetical protein [Pantanalinema sp. GBBB05]